MVFNEEKRRFFLPAWDDRRVAEDCTSIRYVRVDFLNQNEKTFLSKFIFVRVENSPALPETILAR